VSWYATEASTIGIEIQRMLFHGRFPGIEKSRNPSHGTLFASCWIAPYNLQTASLDYPQNNTIYLIRHIDYLVPHLRHSRY
jgi:hypothetical protein